MLLLNTTIRLQDYADVLAAGARIECEPVEEGAAPHYAATGSQRVVRTAFHLRLTLPPAPSGNVTLDDAGSQLLARLAYRGLYGNATSVLAFGRELAGAHSDLVEGTSCGVQVAATHPWYRVTAVERERNGRRVVATLVPAELSHMFSHAALAFEWDPREGAVARRLRAAGVRVAGDGEAGDNGTATDAAGRRLVIKKDEQLAGINLNYNPTTKRAQHDIDFKGALRCENCYAFFDVSMHARLKFCALVHGGFLGEYWAWDSTYLPGSSINGVPYDGGYQYDKGDDVSWTSSNLPPDCSAIGVASPSTATFGFNVSAWIEGSAGFSFKLISEGYSGAGNSEGCDTRDVNNPACAAKQIVPPTSQTPISLDISGIPITLEWQIGLSAALVWDGSVEGQLQLGASASAGAIKVGAQLTYNGATHTFQPIVEYEQPSYSVLPTIIRLDSFDADVKLRLEPLVSISPWGMFPIISETRTYANLAVKSGEINLAVSAASRRFRSLASAAQCPTEGGFIGASTENAVLVRTEAVTWDGVGVKLGFPSLLSTGVIIPALRSSEIPLPNMPLISRCLQAGVELNSQVTPACCGPACAAAPLAGLYEELSCNTGTALVGSGATVGYHSAATTPQTISGLVCVAFITSCTARDVGMPDHACSSGNVGEKFKYWTAVDPSLFQRNTESQKIEKSYGCAAPDCNTEAAYLACVGSLEAAQASGGLLSFGATVGIGAGVAAGAVVLCALAAAAIIMRRRKSAAAAAASKEVAVPADAVAKAAVATAASTSVEVAAAPLQSDSLRSPVPPPPRRPARQASMPVMVTSTAAATAAPKPADQLPTTTVEPAADATATAAVSSTAVVASTTAATSTV